MPSSAIFGHRCNTIASANSSKKCSRNSACLVWIKTKSNSLDSHTLEVGEEKITADKILIAVGGHPVKPDIPGIEHTVVSDAMFNGNLLLVGPCLLVTAGLLFFASRAKEGTGETTPSFLQMLGIMVADPFYAVIGKKNPL